MTGLKMFAIRLCSSGRVLQEALPAAQPEYRFCSSTASKCRARGNLPGQTMTHTHTRGRAKRWLLQKASPRERCHNPSRHHPTVTATNGALYVRGVFFFLERGKRDPANIIRSWLQSRGNEKRATVSDWCLRLDFGPSVTLSFLALRLLYKRIFLIQ